MCQTKCPMCNESDINSKFISYNNVAYSVCSYCKTSYQDPIIKTDYENVDWGNLPGPDGKTKNLKLEKDFKIKNWYGETIKFLNDQSGGSILDIGCGLGYFLSALDDKWEKYGLETSDDSINFINKSFKDLKIYKGTLEKNDLALNKTFNVIFFYHVIEHLTKPLEAINKIKLMLKPGGLLIIGTPNASSVCAKIFKNKFRLLGPGHIFLTTHSQMKKVLVNKDFKIEKEEFLFFKTDYFNFKNILRLFMFHNISPPFYGSIMTIYARKNYQ